MDAEKTGAAGTTAGRKIASAQEIKVTTGSESTTGLEVMAWLEVHKQKLIYAGVAVLAAVVIGVIYNHWSSSKELAANEALLTLRSAERGKPVPAEKFLQLVSEYAGTDAAKRALLLGAEALFLEGKYDQAKATFERFLAENPGHVFGSQADLGIAACLDAANKPAEALKAYDDVRKRYGQEGGIASQARLAIGRIYESQGKFVDAFKTYSEITQGAPYAYNTWMEEAFTRADQLRKAHPEVAALLKPAAQPMPIIMTNPPPPAPKPATNAPAPKPATNPPAAK